MDREALATLAPPSQAHVSVVSSGDSSQRFDGLPQTLFVRRLIPVPISVGEVRGQNTGQIGSRQNDGPEDDEDLR